MTDLTRLRKYNQKKVYSVAATEVPVDFSDFDGTNQLDLFNLPANCIVTNAHIIVHGAFDASRTLDVGFAGGAELINNGVISSAAVITDALSVPVQTTTGKVLTIVPSAAVTQGSLTIVIEFIEYKVSRGDLMQVAQS